MSLTKAQKARVIKVIERDAEIRYRYSDKQGRTCALGGLAKAAKIALPTDAADLEMRIAPFGLTAATETLRALAKKLCEAYGLSLDQLDNMQGINDGAPTRVTRRRRLIKYVESL